MVINCLSRVLTHSFFLFCVFFLYSFTRFTYACVICVPYPTKSIADYLLESETIVLARENPNKLWSYIAIETLKGEVTLSPIDYFLDSSTRRMLNIYPKQAVLFVKDLKDEKKWRNLGFIDDEYEKVIRKIVKLAPTWQQQDDFNEQRLNFFSQYLGNENRKIHSLAYLEIGKAPYNQIKDLDTSWSIEKIRVLLRNPKYIEWHPLAILIMAHKGNASDKEYIVKKFSKYANHNTTLNLSAWATAFIEIKEKHAVNEIEGKYFRTSTRNLEELKEVIIALSEHGNYGHTHLRDQIVKSYSTLLEYHPEMASYVTKDLLIWKRWELSEQLVKILKNIEDTDPLNVYAIKQYLSQAKHFNKS